MESERRFAKKIEIRKLRRMNFLKRLIFGAVLLCLGSVLSWTGPVSPAQGDADMTTGTLKIESSAFREGGMIPKLYTCDGADLSPSLSWGAIPPGAKSLALIVDDPDAPAKTWVHWVVFDLPADSGGLPESVPADPTLASGARQGINDFQRIGYGGPCPPGGTHRYFFKLYALDTRLELDPGSSKSQLLSAMEGHILAEGQLMGRYAR